MFRHNVRHLVKPGEYQAFLEAFRKLNAALPSAGLPRYALWVTLFGNLNEVWADAEYESLDEHVRLWHAARDHEETMAAFRGMLAHVVPGSIRDYPLEPVELG